MTKLELRYVYNTDVYGWIVHQAIKKEIEDQKEMWKQQLEEQKKLLQQEKSVCYRSFCPQQSMLYDITMLPNAEKDKKRKTSP